MLIIIIFQFPVLVEYSNSTDLNANCGDDALRLLHNNDRGTELIPTHLGLHSVDRDADRLVTEAQNDQMSII